MATWCKAILFWLLNFGMSTKSLALIFIGELTSCPSWVFASSSITACIQNEIHTTRVVCHSPQRVGREHSSYPAGQGFLCIPPLCIQSRSPDDIGGSVWGGKCQVPQDCKHQTYPWLTRWRWRWRFEASGPMGHRFTFTSRSISGPIVGQRHGL